MKRIALLLLVVTGIAPSSFSEGNPIYYFDKNKPFIFGKKESSSQGLGCKVSNLDSLYAPPSRVIVKDTGKILFLKDTIIKVDEYSTSERMIRFKKGDTLTLGKYLGEGYWSAIYRDSNINITYKSISTKQAGFLKELVRHNSQHWILIDQRDSCWMLEDSPQIIDIRLEF